VTPDEAWHEIEMACDRSTFDTVRKRVGWLINDALEQAAVICHSHYTRPIEHPSSEEAAVSEAALDMRDAIRALKHP
jgi:hypothetical protein